MRSGHLAIEGLIGDTQNNLKHPLKSKTKNGNWDNWQKHLTPQLSNYIDHFPDNITVDKIEKETKLLNNIIATTTTKYFTQASKKITKKWWSKDIKQARTKLKEAKKKIQNKTVKFKSFTSTISQSKIAKYD